jgi:cell division septation protein DedD
MRNNETGEFELIVGNRQLLSGFFIVVLLFAVAFAMGYVVGQNSPRSAKVAETAAAAPSATEPRPQPAALIPTPPAQAPPPATDTPAGAAPAAETPPQPTTQPAREPSAAPAAPASPDAAPVHAELPGPAGSFWQVIAVAEADAQIIASTLKKRGFPAFLSPGPKGLMRVMVGPYPDTAAMGKAKTDLANAGFPNPYRK